jgi:DmsE family decaheme c-type cytochrome
VRAVAGQDQTCARCHGEKAGPFVYEHPSVRAEGCNTCHFPHGSPYPRLLKRSNLNLMCLDCHTFTPGLRAPGVPAFHDQATQYQACTLCHAAIHGSNFDRLFFK